ncbi:hypothetical protein BC629DRAFT_1590819 [Irpex lacteus]|nr:hypothetical protein BC629DRAFT_1590819 [Irpex lacteus]
MSQSTRQHFFICDIPPRPHQATKKEDVRYVLLGAEDCGPFTYDQLPPITSNLRTGRPWPIPFMCGSERDVKNIMKMQAVIEKARLRERDIDAALMVFRSVAQQSEVGQKFMKSLWKTWCVAKGKDNTWCVFLTKWTDCALTVHNTFDPEFRATDNMIDALEYMLEAARLPPPPTPLVSDTLLHDICELITEDDTGAASRTRPSSNGNAKGKGNAKGNTKGNANSSTKGNASASASANANANAKGKAKATTSGPATQAHEPCTETELEDPEDDDMEQLSMNFLGTRSFVNLRSASGHILGEIHDRDEYDSTPPPPVPTLGHVVDTFVDKWGFSSAFVSALYDAFCESDTLLDFAYHVNGLSISEIEWLWHFIMVPGSIPLYRSRRLRRRVE